MQTTIIPFVFNKRAALYLSVFALLAFLLLAPQYALASEGSGGGLPYESWLTKLLNSVTGPIAFTVSVIGIVGAGCGLIFGGDLNGVLRTLIFIVLVIALVVGAKNILSALTGKGAEITTLTETVTHETVSVYIAK